jgi:hypothetical protein
VAVGELQRKNVIADAGYSNGEQAEACEGKGILPHVPSNRAINNQGDGTFFDRTPSSTRNKATRLSVRLARASPTNS